MSDNHRRQRCTPADIDGQRQDIQASAGNCSAAGSYKDSADHTQAFAVSQVHGTWGKAEKAPSTAALNKGGNATINWLSCAPAGTCSAGGSYTHHSGHIQAFVVSQA